MGREAAGGVHLPLSRLVCRELPIRELFCELLRRGPARARLLRVSVSAVRRSAALPVEVVMDGPVGAAQQQLRDGCGMASARGNVQRRVPARQTAAGTRPAHSRPIRRKRKRRTRSSRSGRSRRRWHRRAIGRFGDCRTSPPSAARCRHCCARRGRGAGGGPYAGTPVPNRYPKHKTAGSPRGSTKCSFWVTVNGREYSREDSE